MTNLSKAAVLALLLAVALISQAPAYAAGQEATDKSRQLAGQMVQVLLNNGQVYQGRYDGRSDGQQIRVRFRGNDAVLIKVFRTRDIARLRPVANLPAAGKVARAKSKTTDAQRALELLFD